MGKGTFLLNYAKSLLFPFFFFLYLYLLLTPVSLIAGPPPFYPFSLNGGYLNVDEAPFHSPEGAKGETLKYAQANAAYAYTHPFNKNQGLIFGAGWVGSIVDWKENPSFEETCFNYVNFSAGYFTTAFPEWAWTITGTVFIDVEVLDLSEYALYQGVLAGKYQCSKSLELDFGCILELGLNKDKIWPIIGFAYKPFSCLYLSVIYPVKISLECEAASWMTLSGAIRFLRNRHRVKDTEPLPKAIFEYRDTGIEVDVNIAPLSCFSVQGFAGRTFRGNFIIANMNGNHGTHYKFNGSFYAGVSGLLSF